MSNHSFTLLKKTQDYQEDGTYRAVVDAVAEKYKIFTAAGQPHLVQELTNNVAANSLGGPPSERKAWQDCFKAIMN